MSIQIRKLVGKDVRIFAGIMAKNLPSLQSMIGDKLSNSQGDQAAPKATEAEELRIGLELAAKILSENIEPLWGWIADLAGMTSEQLDAADAGMSLDIISALISSGQLPGFFAKVRGSLTAAQSFRLKSGIS